MNKILTFFFFGLLLISCGRNKDTAQSSEVVISVSIAPFKYFITEIAGDKFSVNVMVPPGASPHTYEPLPEQITRLGRSAGYISNGYLGFEMAWLDRFYEINSTMKKLSLAGSVEPLINEEHHHEGEHAEGADPHYWVSPKCALSIASSVKVFLTELDPANGNLFNENYLKLVRKISQADSLAAELSSYGKKRTFMIYHPTLAYLARDYGLEEIAVEHDGKEPSPARLKELIDKARSENLKVIMVQREYDVRNVKAVADESGAEVVIIDPLSEDWYNSTVEIINTIRKGFDLNNINR